MYPISHITSMSTHKEHTLLEWYSEWRLAHCAPVFWEGLWIQQSFPHVKCMKEPQGHLHGQSMPISCWCQCTSWSLGAIISVSVCGYWRSRQREVVVTLLGTTPLKENKWILDIILVLVSCKYPHIWYQLGLCIKQQLQYGRECPHESIWHWFGLLLLIKQIYFSLFMPIFSYI